MGYSIYIGDIDPNNGIDSVQNVRRAFFSDFFCGIALF